MDCGEAVGWIPAIPGRPEDGGEGADRRPPTPLEPDAGLAESPDDAEARRDENRGRAARRARTKLRRLATANALEFMWTLTFADEPADRSAVVHEVQKGMKRLQRELGSLRYLWVIERGSKRGRLHVHVLVDRYLEHDRVRSAWGLGHVWVSKRGGKGGARANARANARYLSKYVGKEIAGGIDGRHAYGRSEGLTLGRTVLRLRQSAPDAVWIAATSLATSVGDLAVSWSDEWSDYLGPPAFVAFVT